MSLTAPRHIRHTCFLCLTGLFLVVVPSAAEPPAPRVTAEVQSTRLHYRNPGLVVDLGVGLWAQPLPMDYDGDGDNDLVVATANTPSNGIFFFENTSGKVKYPVFKKAVRVGEAIHNMTVSYWDDTAMVLTPGMTYPAFRKTQLVKGREIAYTPGIRMKHPRAKQWKLVDYDGDGKRDLIIGIGEWGDYGWDNAYNSKGDWTNGPLHGYVYLARNTGTNDAPKYVPPVHVEAGDRPVDVFGCPSPNFADFDGDGDLDLVCGEFLDKLTYFQNIGTRTQPAYAKGHFLTYHGQPISMELEMIQVVAFDWDQDGDTDLVVGQEDGRVALIENTGVDKNGIPIFLPPHFFRQEADFLKEGALSTPCSADWDGDGDEDLIVGDTAGFISFIENLDGGNPPKWAAPKRLKADGKVIRIQAGKNGSIQGPAEAKWGYTVPHVADWNQDGLPDILINSIWGKVMWYQNVGTRSRPRLRAAQPIRVEWNGPTPKPAWLWWTPEPGTLVTQWRTTPCVFDVNHDDLLDLVMLDREGYLAFFQRRSENGALRVMPGKRIFQDDEGNPLRLSARRAGKSGRRKLAFTDWDGDGRLDLLANSQNVDFYRNIAKRKGAFRFRDEGPLDTRKLAGHSTCPTLVHWNKDGIPDLLIGAEDGFFYLVRNSRH